MKVRMSVDDCDWEWEGFSSDFSDKTSQANLVLALAGQFLDLFEVRCVEEVSNNDTVNED